MKTAYFTTANISAKSREFLLGVENDLHLDLHIYQLAGCALLVLDMQDYFLSSVSHAFIPSAPAIVAGINRLINQFANARRPVIFTRHLNTAKNAGSMKHWWREMIMEHNPHSQIVSSMNPDIGTILIKSQYDAFHQTELDKLLKQWNVRSVIVTGVMTHLCCETTARSAFVRGFNVIFPVDGTATYNEQFHLATLRNLAHGFAVIPTIEQLIKVAGTPE